MLTTQVCVRSVYEISRLIREGRIQYSCNTTHYHYGIFAIHTHLPMFAYVQADFGCSGNIKVLSNEYLFYTIDEFLNKGSYINDCFIETLNGYNKDTLHEADLRRIEDSNISLINIIDTKLSRKQLDSLVYNCCRIAN